MQVTHYQSYFGITPKQLNSDDFERLVLYFQLLDKVEKPVVSLLIPIYRAKETLVAHIVSLSKLKTIIPYEVIFVENNADEASLEILRELGARTVSQSKQGITHARQKGLEEARGQILCSMDPDTLYDPYYIDKMVLPFFQDKDLVLCYSVSKSYAHDFQLSSRMKIRNALKVAYFRWKISRCFIHKIKHIRAVGMAIKKEVIDTIGYDTDLRAVSGCDDGMLAIHLYNKGRFKYIPVDIYTALPPEREPGQPFPFCNGRFYDFNAPIEEACEELGITESRV